MAKQIIHYATAPQTPLCYRGTTDRVTESLPAVTCHNCIETKRRETLNDGIDWSALQTKMHDLIPAASERVKGFSATTGFIVRVSEESYPPRIRLSVSIPERSDKRRRAADGCAFATDDELDTIGSFVASLAEELGLRASRMIRQTPVVLAYDLKPFYVKR